MGKITNGLHGTVTGTIGNITYYELNGQNISRINGKMKRPKRSKNQLANEQKMAVIGEFFHSIGMFLKVGFAVEARGTTSNYHNKATSYNKKYAIKGEYPHFEMDYEKVLLSKGDLEPAISPSIEVLENGFRFNWEVTDNNWEYNSAQVMMIAYFPEKKAAHMVTYGAQRSARTDLLEIPRDMKNQKAELYISFVSGDRNRIANSTYLGSYIMA